MMSFLNLLLRYRCFPVLILYLSFRLLVFFLLLVIRFVRASFFLSLLSAPCHSLFLGPTSSCSSLVVFNPSSYYSPLATSISVALRLSLYLSLSFPAP